MDKARGIRVLHVDDEPDFADIAADFLKRTDDRFTVETATRASEGLDKLADGKFDCIVSDYQMPGQNGIEFLETVRDDYPDLPFILFTGKGSEEVASDAISAGATDYLQKAGGIEQYELLANRIQNAVEQYRTQREISETEHRLQTIAEHTNDVLWQFTADWNELLFVNSAYEEIWGRSITELREQPQSFLKGIHPEDRAAVQDGMEQLSSGESVDIEYRVNAEEDFRRWVWVQGKPITTTAGEVDKVVGFARDITERKQRERRLEAITKATTKEAIYLKDTDGRYQFINEAGANVFNRKPEEVLGKRAADLYDSVTRDRLEVDERVIENEESISYEVTRVVDGEDHHFLSEKQPYYENGELFGLVGISRDITEHKRREEELRQIKHFNQEVVENAPVALFRLDEKLRITYENPQAKRIVGVPESKEQSDAIGTDIREIPSIANTEVADTFSRLLDGDEIEFEFSFESIYGKRAYVSGRAVPLYHQDEFDGAILMAVDISERKKKERDLQRQNERLEEFANIVSHDLRNPLNVASGNLSLLREEYNEDYLDGIESAISRMDQIIDDVLTMARAGQTVEDTERLTLSTVVADSWKTVNTETADLLVEDDVTFEADRGRLQHILENLFRNAIEHGGNDVTVRVDTHSDGFYVADDGAGIPTETREQIFEQGFSTTTDGTGFGLNIVEQMVEAHGWNISVTESREGGARFDISDIELLADDAKIE